MLGGIAAVGCKGSAAPTPCPNAAAIAGCTVAIAPSADDYGALSAALAKAKAGSTVCLCPGTFNVNRELDVATEKITLRGAGASDCDTIVDFKGQTTGDKSIGATGASFTISNMWIKNPPADGVDVTGTTAVTFKDLKVTWDVAMATGKGGYAVYPVTCTDVLIDTVEVSGAADSGIYVGQSTKAIVKNSKVYNSVAGIESENSTDVEIFDNEVFDNTTGMIVSALPDLDKKDALRTHVHDNLIHDNNRANFAATGATVESLPFGFGILIIGAHDAEIDANTIVNQDTSGVALVSGNTFELIRGKTWDDPATDRFPAGCFIHDNAYTNVGTSPSPLIAAAVGPGVSPIEEVLWDGDEASPGAAKLCLGSMNIPTFRDVKGLPNFGTPASQSTDPTPFECSYPTLPPVTF